MKAPFPSVLLFLGLTALAPAAAPDWRNETYVSRDAAKARVAGQVARLVVPEDPAKPDGTKIELALMRLPATTATPGAPIVYLHGGPGGAGAEHLDNPGFRALFAALQTQGDVILFDQRGCGQSKPSFIPHPPPRPEPDLLASRERLLDFLARTSVAVRDRAVQAGHDPHLYTVPQSVADLEAIRRALGAERIHLFAHSYGTQLAQAFMRAHPSSVARAVLVGSRGMDTARKLPAEADAFLGRIAELARADATVGAKFPDLLATFRRVLAKLDAAPVAVEMECGEKKEPMTFRVGGDALRFIVAKFYLGDPDNFKYLPKLLDELDTGRRPWSLVFNIGTLLRAPISYTWLTTDAASGVTAARAAAIRAQAPTALLREAMNFPFPEINRVWTMSDLGDAFRAPVRTELPTLFVVGSLDGITPVGQTREIMRTFAAARLLVVENGGHNSLFRPAEVPAAIASFYGGRTPPESVRMPPVEFMPLVATR